ncbi:YkgJ family cysteine cluster protein [uncultured Xylophilus sp.]|uniref:YkgJ family cysteine cluster protein n=1 Tax=uncultured Xylophilus sp. TaxID=296832 RepID=UPI0025FE036D|nr:YkgJ family cysteine cluster protein [uncultured Xylophilus sp.]
MTPALAERVPLAMQRARAKVAAAGSPADVFAQLRAAGAARTVAKRVHWLQRAADRHLEPLAAVSACRSGCTHCCHIALTITDAEAQLLPQASGRPAVRPADAVRREDLQAMARDERLQVDALDAELVSCPFLSEGACSVYATCPLACRVQLNLDDDDLLCQLVPGVDVPVPYADATSIRGLWLALQPSALYADIRSFFPAGGTVPARPTP